MTSFPPDADELRHNDEPPLTVVAGWESVLPVPQDPIAAWLDLMDVVEALCPEWPQASYPNLGEYRM